MTKELIPRLRIVGGVGDEAADLIEAQQRDAEFDHAEYKRLRDELKAQLAAAQAQIKVLRDALEKISEGDIGRPHRVEKCIHTKYGFENCEECYCDFAREALAQQTDNSALRELLKAERERCAKVADEWQTAIHDPRYQCDCAESIRAMEDK